MKTRRHAAAARSACHPYKRPPAASPASPPSPHLHDALIPDRKPLKFDGLVRYESALMCILCNQLKLRTYRAALRHITTETHRKHVEIYLKTSPNTSPGLPEGLESLPFVKFLLCTMCNCKVDLDLVDYHIATSGHLKETKLISRVSTLVFKCELCNQELIGYARVMDHLSSYDHELRKGGDPSSALEELVPVDPLPQIPPNFGDCRVCLYRIDISSIANVPDNEALMPSAAAKPQLEELPRESNIPGPFGVDPPQLSEYPMLECRVHLCRIEVPPAGNHFDGTRQDPYDLGVRNLESAQSIVEVGDTSSVVGASGDYGVIQVLQPTLPESTGLVSLGDPSACADHSDQDNVRRKRIPHSSTMDALVVGETGNDYEYLIAFELSSQRATVEGRAFDLIGSSVARNYTSDVVPQQNNYGKRKLQRPMRKFQSAKSAKMAAALPEVLPLGVQKMKEKYFLCSCCNCVFLVDNLYDHVIKKTHQNKLKRRVIPWEGDKRIFSCDTCSCSVGVLRAALQHLRGQQHSKSRKANDEHLQMGVSQLDDGGVWKCPFCQCILRSHQVSNHTIGPEHRQKFKEGLTDVADWYSCEVCGSKVLTKHIDKHVKKLHTGVHGKATAKAARALNEKRARRNVGEAPPTRKLRRN